MSKGSKFLDIRPPPDSDDSSSKPKSKLKSKRKAADASGKKSSSKKRKLAEAQVGSDSGNTPTSKRRRSRSDSESPERTRQENNSLAKEQSLDADINGASSEASQTFSKSKRRRKEKNKTDKKASYQGQEHEPQEGQPEPEQDQELGEAPSTETEGSPFFMQTTSFYVPLSPIAQSAPLDGLCAEHLSPLILTYCSALRGVVLSYSNPRLGQGGETDGLTRAIDEYGPTFIWVTADFTILRPVRDTWLTGYVGVQSASHVGLICWNLFNASIERDSLPGWKWIHGKEPSQSDKDGPAPYGDAHDRTTWRRGKSGRAGHWLDKNKKPIEGALKFRVLDFDSLPAFGKDKSFMSIQGTLLEGDQGDVRTLTHEEATQTTRQSGSMVQEVGTAEVQDEGSDESSSNESEEYNTAHEDRESVEESYSRPESE